MTFFNRKPVHLLLIVATGLLIYARTLHVPFVLDDFESIVNNPLITNFAYFFDFDSGRSFYGHAGFASRWSGYLTLALNYRLHGLELPGYHLVNIGIHLLAALCLYRLVVLTFRTPYFRQGDAPGVSPERAGFVALLAALLFVAHPLQTQAVTYLIQRLASQAALLYLLSLTCYVSARLAGQGASPRRYLAWFWFAAALVSALLACTTKQTAFTLPLTVLLYEALFFTRAAPRKLLRAVLALVGVGGLFGAGALLVSGKNSGAFLSQLDRAARLQTDMPRLDYLATQCRVLVTYLRLVVWPTGQRLDYDYPISHSLLEPAVLCCAGLLGALLAAACYCLYRSRRAGQHEAAALMRVSAFGIFWFFLTASIESSIIPIADVIFEHRVYLPLAGLFISAAALLALAGGASSLLPGWPKLPVLGPVAGVLLVLCGLTVARNDVWRSEVGLWEDNSWKSPNKARVYLNLGSAAERAGDLVGAEAAYSTALTIAPGDPFAHLDLGRLYLQWKRPEEALTQFREVLAADPAMGEAHNNIGNLLEAKKQYDQALAEYRLAVQAKPYLAVPHCNIADLQARQGRFPEALKEYGQAIVCDPYYLQAYLNRGKALLALGRRGEAAADFRRALKLKPGNAEALQQLQLAQGSR